MPQHPLGRAAAQRIEDAVVPGRRHADEVHVVLNGCVENRLHHVAVTNDDLIVRMTQFRRGASDVDELDKPDSSKEKGRSGAELRESMGSRERLETLLASSGQVKLSRVFIAFIIRSLRHYIAGFVGAILFFTADSGRLASPLHAMAGHSASKTRVNALVSRPSTSFFFAAARATGDVAPPRLGLWDWSVPPWCRLLDSGASLWRK
jgi:hypothetical protein